MKAKKQNPSFTSYSIPISSGVNIKLHLCRIHEIGCVARMHARGVDLTLSSTICSGSNPTEATIQWFIRQTLFWWGNDHPVSDRFPTQNCTLKRHEREMSAIFVLSSVSPSSCKTQHEPPWLLFRLEEEVASSYPTWNFSFSYVVTCDYWSQVNCIISLIGKIW